MSLPLPPLIVRMQSLIEQWETSADQRVVFLNCYRLMTENMLAAIERGEFYDPPWVNRFLHGFAEYYFVALDAYDLDPSGAPRVWQLAHGAARDPGVFALQKLLLGVNAHINFDLMLNTVDFLELEWDALTPEILEQRHADYRRVNDIIGTTIDAVQDTVLEPAMPLMELVDIVLGPVDEILISRLLSNWREKVWEYAIRRMETRDPVEQARLVAELEDEAIQLGELIQMKGRFPRLSALA